MRNDEVEDLAMPLNPEPGPTIRWTPESDAEVTITIKGTDEQIKEWASHFGDEEKYVNPSSFLDYVNEGLSFLRNRL